MRQCKKHIINHTEGKYEVKSLDQDNLTCFQQRKCKHCGKVRHIYSNDVCKSCYQILNKENWNNQYILTGQNRGRKSKIDIKKVSELRQQNKSFQQIANIFGVSRQAIQRAYSNYEKEMENQK